MLLLITVDPIGSGPLPFRPNDTAGKSTTTGYCGLDLIELDHVGVPTYH